MIVSCSIHVLYDYIKMKNRSSSKIGPFYDKDKCIIKGTSANILLEQYTSVFTTPRIEYTIGDIMKFYNNCDKCEAEYVHECIMDGHSTDSYNVCKFYS